MEVERMGDNSFPLPVCNISRDSTGVTALYQFYSSDCLCTSYPRLICQGTATLNGTALEQIHGAYMIGGVVREGDNTLEVRGAGETPSATLVGEFGVWAAEDGGWQVGKARPLELGSLGSQGLPFYTGTVAYRRTVEVPEKVGKHILRIPSWKGEACSVWVNYQKVAVVSPGRFKMDISPYLEAGTNDIEVRISGASGAFGLLKDFTLE